MENRYLTLVTEDELYTGNVFKDLDEEDEGPVTLNDFFKRK